jgi:hypothetical protein
LIAWILKELEKNPSSVFHKQDLLKKSEQQFEELKRIGLLTYVQPDLNCETYPCSLPCANTCPMDIAEVGGKLFAICPKDSEIDPIPLDRDDLDKYAFCMEKFLEHVRIANGLGGALNRIEQDYWYFGYKTYKDHRVGFIFGFTIAHKSLLEITGLKCLCADDDFLVVFSPASVIEDVTHKRELDRERFIQTSLALSLNFQTYEFSIEKLLSGLIARGENEIKSSVKVLLAKANKWEDISIEVVDDQTLKYKVGAGNWQRADYTEFGFRDQRKTLPNKLWSKFLSLARQNRVNVNSPKITPKDIQRIRQILRKTFGLRGMPIKRYDKNTQKYLCEFEFVDPREW